MAVNAILIVLFLMDTTLIYLLYTYNPFGAINRFLSFLLIPITLTNLEMLLLFHVGSHLPVKIGLNMSIFGVVFFFPLFYHFSSYFPRKRVGFHIRELIALMYILPLILGVALIVTFDPETSILSFRDFLSLGEYLGENPLYFIFYIFVMVYILFLLFMTVYRLIRSLKFRLLKRERKTVIMVLMGFIPLSFALLFNYLIFLPLKGGIYFYLTLSSVYTIYFLILIFQFGYIDRKSISRFFIIYPLLLLFMIIVYEYFLSSANCVIAKKLYVKKTFLVSLEILLFFILVSPIVSILERKVGKIIAPVASNLCEVLRSASVNLSGIIDIDELDKFLTEFFTERLRLNRFFFMIRDETTGSFRVLSNENSGSSDNAALGNVSHLDAVACPLEFPVNGELARKLEEAKRIMDLQQIALSWEGGSELEVLDRLKISLVVPLFSENRLEGICLLSEPGVARPWHQPEIDELSLFFAGIPVVIERWKLHSMAIQMEQKQARVEKLAVLNAITSEIAHEIRNPLSIIATAAETIETKELSREELLRFIRDIRDEIKRMSNLLRRILSLPSQSGKNDEHCDVKEAVERTFKLISRKALEKHISLRFMCETSNYFARINRESFIQVCLNLSLNAIESLPEGGKFQVVLSERDGEIELLFSDNGPGIPREIVDNIFEPFFTTKKNGTGLGLAVSRRIIKEAKGNLELVRWDGGTTFKITIPAC